MNRSVLSFAALLLAAAVQCAMADNPAMPLDKKWKDAAEVSLVTTNGNSKATTTSAKNTFQYSWSKETILELIGSALGSSSGGTVTAENYLASEKYTLKLVGRNYAYESFKWDKDRFAGIRNRYDYSMGLGRLMVDLPNDKLNTELGGGYVNEERTEEPRNDYASGRAYAKYEHAFSKTSSFFQTAEYLHNFKDSRGYRMTTETGLVAALTSHVSLKTSFLWKRNAAPPAGAVKDDTLTSAALIINY